MQQESRTKYGFLVAHCRGFQGKDERSDAVAERSEVNPAVQQCFCLLRQGFVRERRSKAKRLRQSRRNITIPRLSALSWCVSHPIPHPYKRNT